MKKIKIILTTIFFLMYANSYLTAENIPLKNLEEIIEPSGFNQEQKDPEAIARNIGLGINIFISILGIIFVILIIYAGYKWMMAQGDKNEVEKAKSIINRAIIGLIIIVGSFAIWNLIARRLLSID